mmetsp:Transcript_45819/g.127110  ORF Transcript_45819/g.127110 Transcript_45819/m.127110 type:complete len:106 (-) Transcript_45819:119-436(-)
MLEPLFCAMFPRKPDQLMIGVKSAFKGRGIAKSLIQARSSTLVSVDFAMSSCVDFGMSSWKALADLHKLPPLSSLNPCPTSSSVVMEHCRFMAWRQETATLTPNC